jgi:hypothetical protein
MINGYYEFSDLVGGVITETFEDEDEEFDEIVQGMRVLLTNGKSVNVWILRDEEGNGAGFAYIAEG